MANKKIIKIPICMAVSTYTVRDTIQQGDVDAYRLEITLTDIDQIDGRAELRFVFPDGQYADREAEITENVIRYDMEPADYSQLGDLKCYVRVLDNNLLTPVLLVFTGIRSLVGNVEFEGEIQPYPQWAKKLKQQVDELAGAGTYVHTQGIASNNWLIEHDLGYYPNVAVVDSSGRQVLTQIEYIDENTLRSITEFAFGGKAYCS